MKGVCGMIDIHCHILPGIDDGARTVEESLDLAREAVREGIRTIIATPHHMNGRYKNPKHLIENKVNELNSRLKAEEIDIEVLAGQESAIHGEMVKGYEKGEILPLNGTQYVFVELPAGHVPRYTEKMLYELQLRGLIPIIVHPERNQEIFERPDLLYALIEKGALGQLTASSIAGIFGKKIKNFSEQLVEANLVHFIASDAHNLGKRSFYMQQAFDHLDTRYGTDMVYFFQENAELLVEGSNIFKDVPAKVKKKKFLGFF